MRYGLWLLRTTQIVDMLRDLPEPINSAFHFDTSPRPVLPPQSLSPNHSFHSYQSQGHMAPTACSRQPTDSQCCGRGLWLCRHSSGIAAVSLPLNPKSMRKLNCNVHIAAQAGGTIFARVQLFAFFFRCRRLRHFFGHVIRSLAHVLGNSGIYDN